MVTAAGAPHACFKDAALGRRFDEKGFVVLDAALDETALRRISDHYERHRDRYLYRRYISTMEMDDEDHRIGTSNLFFELTSELADALFKDYVQYYGGYGVKHPTGDASILGMHQDLTMVPYDAPRTGLTLWVPMADVDHRNGCIQAVPGSHRLNRCARAVGMDYAYSDIEEWICDEHLKFVPMKRGQVLVMDQALSHRSGSNDSAGARVAIMGMFRPRETSLRYYLLNEEDPSGTLDVYEVPDDFYLRQRLGDKPYAGEFRGRIPRVTTPFPDMETWGEAV
jgi:ectoine hydroxylase-related dioxygenase (phytanoyl-CoA dioxygenase family)